MQFVTHGIGLSIWVWTFDYLVCFLDIFLKGLASLRWVFSTYFGLTLQKIISKKKNRWVSQNPILAFLDLYTRGIYVPNFSPLLGLSISENRFWWSGSNWLFSENWPKIRKSDQNCVFFSSNDANGLVWGRMFNRHTTIPNIRAFHPL